MIRGTCNLCLKENIELHASHIIPKWVFKRLRDNGVKVLISITQGHAEYDTKQYTDYLLCSTCESKIKLFEDAMLRIAYNKNGISEILNSLEEFVPREPNSETKFYYVSSELADKLYKFGLSVIWRASISKREEYKSINLGKKYNEIARLCLINRNQYNPRISVVPFLYLKQGNIHDCNTRILDYPTSSCNKKSNYCYFFAVCGLFFRIFVGSKLNDKGYSINNFNILIQTNKESFIKSESSLELIQNAKPSKKMKDFSPSNKKSCDCFIPSDKMEK